MKPSESKRNLGPWVAVGVMVVCALSLRCLPDRVTTRPTYGPGYQPGPVASVSTVSTASVGVDTKTTLEVYRPGKGPTPLPLPSPAPGTCRVPLDLGGLQPGDRLLLTLDTNAWAFAQAGASATVQVPQNQPRTIPVGVLVHTAPGLVSLDYRVWEWNRFGLDVQANQFQAGGGISYGENLFGEAGYSLGFDGHQRPYLGLGIRFSF